MQIHFRVLHRPPEPFDKYIVPPGTLDIHIDFYIPITQIAGKGLTGKLAALISIQYFRSTITLYSLTESLYTQMHIHSVGQLPGQHAARMPIQYGDQIYKTLGHREWSKKQGVVGLFPPLLLPEPYVRLSAHRALHSRMAHSHGDVRVALGDGHFIYSKSLN